MTQPEPPITPPYIIEPEQPPEAEPGFIPGNQQGTPGVPPGVVVPQTLPADQDDPDVPHNNRTRINLATRSRLIE